MRNHKQFNTIEGKEVCMMPLSMVGAGEENTIQRIGGKEETRKFLETLGFVVGGKVTVVFPDRRQPDCEYQGIKSSHRQGYGQ